MSQILRVSHITTLFFFVVKPIVQMPQSTFELMEELWAKLERKPDVFPPECATPEDEIVELLTKILDDDGDEVLDSFDGPMPIASVLASFCYNKAFDMIVQKNPNAFTDATLRVAAVVGNTHILSTASVDKMTESDEEIPNYGLSVTTPLNIALRENPGAAVEYLKSLASKGETYIPYDDDGGALLQRGNYADFIAVAPFFAKGLSFSYDDALLVKTVACDGFEWASGVSPAPGTPEAAALTLLMAPIKEADNMSGLVYTLAKLNYSQFSTRMFKFLQDVISNCGVPLTFELIGCLALASPSDASVVPARAAVIDSLLARAPSAEDFVEYLGEDDAARLLMLAAQGGCTSLVKFLLDGEVPVTDVIVAGATQWDPEYVGSSGWAATAAEAFTPLAQALIETDEDADLDSVYTAAAKVGAADVIKALELLNHTPSFDVVEQALMNAAVTPVPQVDKDDDEEDLDAESGFVLEPLKRRERAKRAEERAVVLAAIEAEQRRLGKFLCPLPGSKEGADACFYCFSAQEDDECKDVCQKLQVYPLPGRKETLELIHDALRPAAARTGDDLQQALQEVLHEAACECPHGFRALLAAMPRNKARALMIPKFDGGINDEITRHTKIEAESFGGKFLGDLCGGVGGYYEPSTVPIQLAAVSTVLGFLPPRDLKLALHAGYTEGKSALDKAGREESFQTLSMLFSAGSPIKPFVINGLLAFIVLQPGLGQPCPEEFATLREPSMRAIKDFFADLSADEVPDVVEELNRDKGMFAALSEMATLESDEAKEMLAFFAERGIVGNPEEEDAEADDDSDNDVTSMASGNRASEDLDAMMAQLSMLADQAKKLKELVDNSD